MNASTALSTQMITETADTSTESRALRLLGDGVKPEIVAASLGITPSMISQLLSDSEFAARVAELRYQNLAKHNVRDGKYDALEDDLVDRLADCLPLMHRPMEILKAIQVINAAKRRGSSTPEALIEKQQIIQLVMPIQIINKFQFQSDINGQVTKVGEKDLLTIQSGALDGLVKNRDRRNNDGSSDVPARIIESQESN